MRTKSLVALSLALLGLPACGNGAAPTSASGNDEAENVGELEVNLINAPTDTSCLRVTVTGARTDARSFGLVPGKDSVFKMKGLPVGNASVQADAFSVACNKLTSGQNPTWYSEAVAVKISASKVTQVALLMIHNGLLSVGVDFSESHAPSPSLLPPLEGGTFSSAKPYLVPVAPGVKIKAILTVGDSPNKKPDGVTPYRMVGLPDGLGAYDNGDDTFTLLSNHELGSATTGVLRAHGAKGAFVSRWQIRKADLAVMHGEDLMQQEVFWNKLSSSYDAPTTGVGFGRFCSASLSEPGALFDVASGLGFDGQLFFDGEETGNEGRGMIHGLDGTSYEFPRMGKMSFENIVPNAGPGASTLMAATDDSGGGQVYFYVGTKTSTGNAIDKAGLTNGTLYGLKVTGSGTENPATGISAGPFTLFSFGNVQNMTGGDLETASNTNLVSKFQRPEDSAWDPNDPNDYYFVTTAAFTEKSRLWRVRFSDYRHPELGGSFEMLLDGTEGQKMFDNMTLDRYGHVYLVEDVGGNDHVGKVWRYDIETDTLAHIASHDATLFDPTIASPTFITNDEEASGIIDASAILGDGWLLVDVQSHKTSADSELVEGGQYLAIYDPAGDPATF